MPTTAHGLETGPSTMEASVSSTQFLEPLGERQQWCMDYSDCSGVASLTSPLRVFSSNDQGFVTSNALGGRWNTMWSTQTPHSQERTQITSHCAGLWTALQPSFPSNQHERLEWHPERKMMVTHLLSSYFFAWNTLSLYFTGGCASIKLFSPLSPVTGPNLNLLPFLSLLLPLPIGNSSFTLHICSSIPTNKGLWCWLCHLCKYLSSVHPTPALVPPSSHLTSLPLVSAAIPLNPISFSPLFANPVSHVPLQNIHVSKQNYLVRSPATAALCMASEAPLLPEWFPHAQLPHVVSHAHGLGGESSLRSGLSPSWEALVPAALGSLPVEPVVSLSCITSVIDGMAMEGGYISRELDGFDVSCNPGDPSLDIRCGRVGSSLKNATCFKLSSQQSRPVLGIAPTVVNRTHVFVSLPFPSLVLNITPLFWTSFWKVHPWDYGWAVLPNITDNSV